LTTSPQLCQKSTASKAPASQATSFRIAGRHHLGIAGDIVGIRNLVLDNYATYKASPVKACFSRHLRYHLRLKPTSASWHNQVERWFALLADRQIKRGVHRSVHELKADITAFIQTHNADPKPFVWTKGADAILQTIARFCSDTLAIDALTC
jgi:putative transposase